MDTAALRIKSMSAGCQLVSSVSLPVTLKCSFMKPSIFWNDTDQLITEIIAEHNPSHPNTTDPVCNEKQKKLSKSVADDGGIF